MDFDEAIAAHSAWKQKLKAYLAKPDHHLKVEEVGADDKCELGRWIKSEYQKHSDIREFATLRTDHARFHQAAADVVKRADSGQKVTEEVALGARSEFATASSAVITDLMALKKKLAPVH
jgi:hypothetical protein